MINREKNIIQKTIIDLQYNGDKDGFMLQEEIADWCHKRLLAGLEEELQQAGLDGKVLKIDKLEFDLEIDATGDWMDKLLKELTTSVSRELSSRLGEITSADRAELLPASAIFFQAFIHFLENGYLPWWSDIEKKESLLNGLDELLTAGITEKMRFELEKSIRHERVQERLIWQLPTDLFFKLMEAIRPEDRLTTKILEADIQNLIRDLLPAEKKSVEERFKKYFLRYVTEVDWMMRMEKTIKAFVREMIDDDLIHLLQPALEKLQYQPLREEVQHELIKISGEKHGQVRTDKKIRSGDSIIEEKKISKPELPESKQTSGVDEGIYVCDAGLVVIAAFLPAFFERLQLLKNSEITDKAQAVCLLQYLLAGNEEAAEFELVVAKVLCGLEPEMPVDTMIPLTVEQKQEADEMLSSVIEHWKILKDTSVAGLRESFLRRNGKLFFNDNSWHLLVEQKGYDMLLRNIPWNISMIRLAWMKHMLKTQWID